MAKRPAWLVTGSRAADVTWLSRLSDHRDERSLAARLRAKRFAFFNALLERVPRPLSILDVGGTVDFWKGFIGSAGGIEITVLNTYRQAIDDPRFRGILGDARDLSAFGDRSIDVVYSNSVIEHVGIWADQATMANEVRRIAKRYFVQTPNAWFPIEPHFLVPGFQFMPSSLRAFLLTRFKLGWLPREPDPMRAREVVDSVRLLTIGQMRRLFPEATLHYERFGGLTKSIVVYHGW